MIDEPVASDHRGLAAILPAEGEVIPSLPRMCGRIEFLTGLQDLADQQDKAFVFLILLDLLKSCYPVQSFSTRLFRRPA